MAFNAAASRTENRFKINKKLRAARCGGCDAEAWFQGEGGGEEGRGGKEEKEEVEEDQEGKKKRFAMRDMRCIFHNVVRITSAPFPSSTRIPMADRAIRSG